MGKALLGISIAVIAFFDYCCCRAASLAEQRLDYTPPGNQREGGAHKGSEN